MGAGPLTPPYPPDKQNKLQTDKEEAPERQKKKLPTDRRSSRQTEEVPDRQKKLNNTLLAEYLSWRSPLCVRQLVQHYTDLAGPETAEVLAAVRSFERRFQWWSPATSSRRCC